MGERTKIEEGGSGTWDALTTFIPAGIGRFIVQVVEAKRAVYLVVYKGLWDIRIGEFSSLVVTTLNGKLKLGLGR